MMTATSTMWRRTQHDWQAAADRLAMALEAVDSRVIREEWQGYWADFLSDITIGDFATSLVLSDGADQPLRAAQLGLSRLKVAAGVRARTTPSFMISYTKQ